MNRVWPLVLVAAVLSAPSVGVSPGTARAQGMCEQEHDSFVSACVLGTPGTPGVTLRDDLDSPTQVRAYRFRVGPEPAAAYIYLGDLWYDLTVALWRDPPDSAASQPASLVTESQASERRVIQFMQPLVLAQQLEPGSYTVFVRVRNEAAFAPNRGYTLRVALGPPICDSQHDPGGVYQLGLAYQPAEPTPFSLMTFTAILAPPYSDLFDFDWEIDGQPLPRGPRETMQVAALDLASVSSSEHEVRVTARGARAYPDPDPQFRQVPPTLSVACRFHSLS